MATKFYDRFSEIHLLGTIWRVNVCPFMTRIFWQACSSKICCSVLLCFFLILFCHLWLFLIFWRQRKIMKFEMADPRWQATVTPIVLFPFHNNYIPLWLHNDTSSSENLVFIRQLFLEITSSRNPPWGTKGPVRYRIIKGWFHFALRWRTSF